MSIRRVSAIVLRQFYLLRGSPARLLPIIAWVAIDIVLWGFITRYLNSIAFSAFNFVSLLLGAVLFWDFCSRIMHGVTTAFLEDVWSRNFLNIFATPLSIPEYLAGLVITSFATGLLALMVMLALAATVFGLSFLGYGAALIPFLLVLFLFGIAIGIVGCSIVLRFGPASEWLVWPIPALLSPLAGVFYPVSTLPEWMRYLSRLLPPSYVFEGMRAIVSGGGAPGNELVWGACLDGLYVLLACWLFTRTYRYAVRTGLLARYSAESVG